MITQIRNAIPWLSFSLSPGERAGVRGKGSTSRQKTTSLQLYALLFACAVLAMARPAHAAEPAVSAADLPRIPPTEPQKALSTFKVKAGFKMDLVAAEPLVMDPVAMAFDEDGRLYVVEMRDYSERRDERLGRIRVLEDTDGDGHFDKSTVFADNLPLPTAIICYNGGIFLGATPPLFYLKGTKGDGKAGVAGGGVHGFCGT